MICGNIVKIKAGCFVPALALYKLLVMWPYNQVTHHSYVLMINAITYKSLYCWSCTIYGTYAAYISP